MLSNWGWRRVNEKTAEVKLRWTDTKGGMDWKSFKEGIVTQIVIFLIFFLLFSKFIVSLQYSLIVSRRDARESHSKLRDNNQQARPPYEPARARARVRHHQEQGA